MATMSMHNESLGIKSVTSKVNPTTGLGTITFNMTKRGFRDAERRRRAYEKMRARNIAWAEGWSKHLSHRFYS